MYAVFSCISARGCLPDLNPWPHGHKAIALPLRRRPPSADGYIICIYFWICFDISGTPYDVSPDPCLFPILPYGIKYDPSQITSLYNSLATVHSVVIWSRMDNSTVLFHSILGDLSHCKCMLKHISYSILSTMTLFCLLWFHKYCPSFPPLFHPCSVSIFRLLWVSFLA
jgi:hypothetical protein